MVAHTTTPRWMAEVYATGLLTRVVDPGVVVYYLRLLDHLFWRILCQIRNIKYCAEPSVRESPEHEGSLQRRARFTELLRISPASPERYPGTPAILTAQIKLLQLRATLSDEDNVIAKRGTRGGNLYITSFVTRGETSLEQRCSPRLSAPSIRKIEEGNIPMSVPTTTEVNCITTFQEYEV